MSHPDPLRKNNVRVTGQLGSPRCLVFVHGFGTDQTAWHPVAAEFEAEFQVVLLDAVGAGQSDPAAFVQHKYLKLQPYADDLLDVCDALSLDRPVVIGHSAGAMAAALAAVKRPERFGGLVMLGASPRYLNDDGYVGGFTEADLSQVYSSVLGSFADWVASFAPMAMGNPERPELARRFAQTLQAVPPDRVLTVLCSILQSDHRAEMSAVRVPTLILQAQGDGLVPLAVAEFLHRQIMGSQLKMLNASGHFPHLSAPQVVVDAMRGFVRRVAGCWEPAMR
jgi:sigma-B regulation protein RsbQ